jgi:hypothetical protein
LEQPLNYATMIKRPRGSLIFWATRGLYAMFVVFWLWGLFQGSNCASESITRLKPAAGADSTLTR